MIKFLLLLNVLYTQSFNTNIILSSKLDILNTRIVNITSHPVYTRNTYKPYTPYTFAIYPTYYQPTGRTNYDFGKEINLGKGYWKNNKFNWIHADLTKDMASDEIIFGGKEL